MKIRAHHLLCLLGFQGLGYSPDFIRRMAETRKALDEGQEFEIEVVEECDDICPACPYFSELECRKGKFSARRTREMDGKVLKTLGLKRGETLNSSLVIPLIRERLGEFPLLVKICGRCGWREVCTYYVDLRESWRKKLFRRNPFPKHSRAGG